MNSSAGNASRKWASGGLACGERLMSAAAALLMMFGAQLDPVEAAQRSRARLQGSWEAPAEAKHPKASRAFLTASVPLPKPRPPEAPARAGAEPAATKQIPAEDGKSTEQTPPAPPPPSACRLALTEEIATAPSIPDIHGAGGCGGEDLVRLEAIVMPDKRQVAVKPAAILRCAMASALADWIRTDIAPLAQNLGSPISVLDNFDSFECRGRN